MNVYLIEDDVSVRDAIALLLRAHGFVVQVFASAVAFLEAAPPLHDACLLLDVWLPGLNGLELLKVLSARELLPPTIVLTGRANVPLAVEAMKLGAFDFIEKPFRELELLASLRKAASRVAEQLTVLHDRENMLELFGGLTPREFEVMKCIVEGNANKVVAARLKISERTVEVHRGRIMKKMKMRSVAELVQAYLLCYRPAESSGESPYGSTA